MKKYLLLAAALFAAAALAFVLAGCADGGGSGGETLAQKEAGAFKTAHATVLGLTVETVGLNDKAKVNAALAAYGSLSAGAQSILVAEKTLLDSLSGRITELEGSAAPQELADRFRADHAAALALTVDTVTLADKAVIDAALSEYNGLGQEVKDLLAAEKALLDSLSAKIKAVPIDFEDDGYQEFFGTYNNASAGDVYNDTATDQKHGGSTSWKVSASAISAEFGNNNFGLQSKPGAFPVEPGKTYRISLWMKTEGVAAGGWSLGAVPSIYVKDGSTNGRNVSEPNTVGTVDWKEVSVLFTADPGDTELDIRLALFGSGTVWFDDIKVEEAALTWTELMNVDFENDSIDPLVDHNYAQATVTAGIAADANNTQGGSKSYKLTATGAGAAVIGNNAGLTHIFDAASGRTYRLSFWVKYQNAAIDTQVGHGMGARVFLLSSTNSELWGSEGFAGTGDWKKVTYDYDAASDGQITIQFAFFCSAGTVWFDDISLAVLDD